MVVHIIFFSNVVLQWLNFVIMSSFLDSHTISSSLSSLQDITRHNKVAIVYNFLEVLFIIVCVSMCLFAC
jgi:hypothetical protein